MEEGNEDDRSGECIVISSDEESMELEPPVTPSAPLTPGSQLDLGLQDWSDPFSREEPEENQYTSQQGLDVMMELQTSEPQDLQPPSPIGLPGQVFHCRRTVQRMFDKMIIGPQIIFCNLFNFLPPTYLK